MQRVLILGGVSYDLLIYVNQLPAPVPATIFAQDSHEGIGSTGAGKALACARLGFAVTLHAPLGADPPGEAARAALAVPDLHFLTDLDPAGTPRHVNLMAADGGRLSIFLPAGSPAPPVDFARLERLIPEHDQIILNIIDYCRRLIPAIQRSGRPVWCDIHDDDGHNPYHADFIKAADYLFLSSDALPDYRAFMRAQIAAGKRLVVCTHGRRGCTALAPGGTWLEVPALTTYPQVDTNGAGDSFFSGVFYGLTRGYPLLPSLRLGTIAGGLAVTTPALAAPDLSPARLHAAYEQHYGPLPAPTLLPPG
jgi:sugar/nucleoside kinase (ribokinase family)